ncbi:MULTISPECIES: hypothetical protein [unclassified Endozoicomonas]|uniref:hypothetical protein n=1 Tax=unclassified Endozoicomonas TaxID=2644528 RepID=UPI003BB4E619
MVPTSISGVQNAFAKLDDQLDLPKNQATKAELVAIARKNLKALEKANEMQASSSDAPSTLESSNPDGPVTPIQHWFWDLTVEHHKTSSMAKISQAIQEGKEILEQNPALSINDCLWWPEWKYVTGLMSVIANGGGEVAIDLITEMGADPFIEDCNRKNLLHLLIAKGHKKASTRGHQKQYPVFTKIIQSESLPVSRHINSQDKYGLTPLHYACARRDQAYIQPLIERGSDPAIKDINDNNCLDVLLMSEQSRLNLISLAVAIEAQSLSHSKVLADYRLDGSQNYFFRDKPIADVFESPATLFNHLTFNLKAFISCLEQPSDDCMSYLVDLLLSAMATPEAVTEGRGNKGVAETAKKHGVLTGITAEGDGKKLVVIDDF